MLTYSDITNDILEYIDDTLTSTIYQDNKIYSVSDNEVKNDKLVSDKYHIVPVITVAKTKIKN